MQRQSPLKRVCLAIGLVLWMGVAPGCSWCRSVGKYYSSGEWYEDVEAVAAFTGVVAIVGVFMVGIGYLLNGQDPSSKSRVSSSLSRGHYWQSGRSRGYSYSDYYRTMSR